MSKQSLCPQTLNNDTSMKSTRLHRHFKRSGPDYRFGDQVCFDELKTTFGFKTITLGNWVTKEEQHLSANLIYDSLADLAQILSLPPTAIGLRGTLNLAFGSGGQKGVQAHYAPSTRTLALAKNAGGGALAHEWWHAFDHYICKHLFGFSKANDFASSLWLTNSPETAHPLNQLLDQIYKSILLSSDGNKPSAFFQRGIHLDKQAHQLYYSLPQELTARAFECFVAHQPSIQNEFLVSDVINSKLERAGGFPLTDEMQPITQNIERYFHTLGHALYFQSN
ncbi:CLCA_X family protein [Pseudoalteromonas luteoviolacea]|nr:CLCA_X family protein [Pseudoalteromonas luteoviolacea]